MQRWQRRLEWTATGSYTGEKNRRQNHGAVAMQTSKLRSQDGLEGNDAFAGVCCLDRYIIYRTFLSYPPSMIQPLGVSYQWVAARAGVSTE